MNKFNPKKLLHSKWTAVQPVNKERHFMVTDVEVDEEGVVIACLIEAVMSKRAREIHWQTLKDDSAWEQGWH